MSKRNLGEKIVLSKYEDMFGAEPEDGTVQVQGEQIKDVALTELHPFKNHPFKVLDDDKMEELVVLIILEISGICWFINTYKRPD